MNLRQRIERLRDEVRSLVTEEKKTIDPLKLSAELDRILQQSENSQEHLRRKYNRRMELWKEARVEMMRAVISFGQGAIRSLILINGGAAVAVMTFVGNLKSRHENGAETLAQSLLLFALGVVAAAIVAGFAYVTQYLYDSSAGRLPKLGIAFHIIAIVSAAVSLGLFVCGLLKAYHGFLLMG